MRCIWSLIWSPQYSFLTWVCPSSSRYFSDVSEKYYQAHSLSIHVQLYLHSQQGSCLCLDGPSRTLPLSRYYPYSGQFSCSVIFFFICYLVAQQWLCCFQTDLLSAFCTRHCWASYWPLAPNDRRHVGAWQWRCVTAVSLCLRSFRYCSSMRVLFILKEHQYSFFWSTTTTAFKTLFRSCSYCLSASIWWRSFRAFGTTKHGTSPKILLQLHHIDIEPFSSSKKYGFTL